MDIRGTAWGTLDRLPAAGVWLSVIVFGGLSVLILGAGLVLTAGKAHKGFDPGTTGQPPEEGGESGPPETRTGGVNR